MQRPARSVWQGFPDVVIHAEELAVKKHAFYAAAKAGDSKAALSLVQDTLSQPAIEQIKCLIGLHSPFLASAHAFERMGVNAIPEALADKLALHLSLRVDASIVQTNIVGHTGASGFVRLARQARFDGVIDRGADYFLVDDFIGQGGTLANLKGFIESRGGRVIGATVLTGRSYSAKLNLSSEQLAALRAKHGHEFELWWRDRFGHGFDCLTQSEARYLERSSDAERIRNSLVEIEQAGNCRLA